MEFRILGPLEVSGSDGPLPLGGAKQRALLALLLLNANRVVGRDWLVDGLWGERPPETAVTTVQVYVSRLRKVLPGGTLVTRPPGYLLVVDDGNVDVQRFERLVREARGAEPARASALLCEALALWRGPPLAEFREEPFARVDAARLEEMLVAALEQRVEAELALGGHGEVVAELEALVVRHPHRERLRAQLMLALYRSGRQTEALAAYRDARSALDELGVEPTAKLKQLERQILAQDTSLDLSIAPPAEPPGEHAATLPQAGSERRAQRKIVTVLFAGVTVSTGTGDALDPEVLGALQAAYLERMNAATERHGGVVENFVGETAMAVFGLPAVHEDDALRALRAAVEMHDAMVELRIEGRIGVDSGLAAVSGERPVTGRAVSRASQLQQAAQAGEILLGDGAMRLARGAVTAAPVELSQGRETVRAWRLVSVSSERPTHLSASSFVGREQELRALHEAWERVRTEQSCELATVVGDAGVGKSRLVAELLQSVAGTVAGGRCLSYGAGITYWPVVEVLRQLWPGLPRLDPAVAAPLRVLLDEERERAASTDELAWAFRKLAEAVALQEPLLLVFDDIQWGEEALLDLIEHLALVSSGAPILLVCMARPELLERRRDWRGVLRLEPLEPHEAEQLIRDRLGDRASAESQRIVAVAGGNPLFVEELSAMLDESGAEQQALPPTIQVLLAARLDQLDADERNVLEAAAVEGEVFHLGAVQALMPERPLTALLTTLVRKELVRRDRPALEGEDAFRFRHLLLRDAAYDSIPKAARSILHEQYADWLAPRGDGMDEFVGYHLEQSYWYRAGLGPLDDDMRALGERAAALLDAGAQRAIDRGDYSAAAKLLERALAVGIHDPRRRAHTQYQLAEYLGRSGRRSEARAIRAEAREAAAQLGDRILLTRSHLATEAPIFEPGTDFQELARIFEDAIETLTELGDHRGLAEAYRYQGAMFGREGRTAERHAAYERALAAAEASGNWLTRRNVMEAISYALYQGPTPVVQAIARCEEMIRSSPDDTVLEAGIGRFMCALVAMDGRSDQAIELLERSLRVFEERAIMWTVPWQYSAAEAREYAGDRAGAIRTLDAWWRLRPDAPFALTMVAGYQLALLHCDEGRWDEAESCLAYGAEVPIPTQFRPEAPLRLAALARVAAHDGRHADAVRLARQAVEHGDLSDMLNLRARVWKAHAEAHRAAGDIAEADGAVATALELYEQKGNVAAAAALQATVPA
jgi:DNA-binding SARP family transcriptional activator